MALVVVSALFGYAWPPYFSGSVRCCSQAETLWRGHILKPWFFGRLDVLLPLKPNKSFSGFFFQRNHGALLCFFLFRGESFIPFQTIFFFVIFRGGWQQHCHLKCPVTVRLVEKTVILSRWSTSMQLSGMWNKFHASSDQNPPTHISLYWLVFLGFGILIMADYNP